MHARTLIDTSDDGAEEDQGPQCIIASGSTALMRNNNRKRNMATATTDVAFVTVLLLRFELSVLNFAIIQSKRKFHWSQPTLYVRHNASACPYNITKCSYCRCRQQIQYFT